jgi:hypothetical protein
MTAARKLELVKTDAGQIEGLQPLVPPGTYRLKFVDWSTFIVCGKAAKLALVFEIIDFGEHFQKRLTRFYNVRRLTSRAGRHGHFAAGPSSDVVREFGTIVGFPSRIDRIPLTQYADKAIVGEVATVEKGRDQMPLPPALQYSTIRKLKAEL